jgi:serine/threonine protein kinase
MPLSPGLVVGGDFRVLARLREGGMGSVWIAEQLSVGRKRALKVMHREIARDARLRERFVQEARIGATIESDHVVEVVGAGIDEALDLPWLAMELLEGKDLGAVLAERGPLSLEETTEILGPLCHALAAAHAAGVVHRDLKPDNVFLARARRSSGSSIDVKVLDFGIAKLAAEALSTGGGSGILGTPSFLAPEQAEPNGVATPALDVWALGLLVYEMLTGQSFWRAARGQGASITALLREVLVDPIPVASTRAAEQGVASLLPEGFDDWLARCLERVPSRRFPEAAEAFAAFGALFLGRSPPPSDVATHVPRSPSSPPSPPSPPSPRSSSISPQARTMPTPVGTSASASTVVQTLHDDENLRAGRIGDVVVIRWRKPPTIVAVEAMDRAIARAIRELGGACMIMPVIDAAMRAPEEDARRSLARSIARFDTSVVAVAYVVRGEGFQAAALRSAITGLMLVARPSHPTKVFAALHEGAAWLQTRRLHPLAERAEEVVAGLTSFCAG